MAITITQSKVTNPVDNADSSNVTFDATPASGSLIVVVIYGWRANASGGFLVPDGSVTDNKTNTYTAAVRGGVSNGANAAIFYSENVTSSATFTITVNPTGTANYFSYTIYELAGAATSSSLDQIASATGTFTAPATNQPATGNLAGTTAQNDEIEFAAVSQNGDQVAITVGVVSPTYTQSQEQLDGVNHQPGEIDHRILTATTNVGASWTMDVTGQWSCVAATFKAAAAAATVRLLASTGVGT